VEAVAVLAVLELMQVETLVAQVESELHLQ
jgi:hypothetical protein